ncbi:MAG TPA: YopX family protein [Ktedonobacteraceae bacterium]|nr:YopX family protein [Ktedonobacteraceae bacterium]
MREIKFRAWDTTNKKMLVPLSGIIWGKPIIPMDYCYGLFNGERPDNYDSMLEEMMIVDDCILMEFTGRIDRLGKEMYEGDIVAYLDNTSQGLVKKTVTITDIRSLPHFGCSKWEEIIGNIYENGDLLK